VCAQPAIRRMKPTSMQITDIAAATMGSAADARQDRSMKFIEPRPFADAQAGRAGQRPPAEYKAGPDRAIAKDCCGYTKAAPT
jgi:hypothetical protein